jgi:hypothetical protein
MLNSLPEDTTQLLIDLCTSTGPLTQDQGETAGSAASTKQVSGAPSYLSYLALSRAAAAPPTVTSDGPPPPSPSIKTVRLVDTASRGEPVIHDEPRSSSPPPTPSASAPSAVKIRAIAPPPVKLPSPRLYFAHFVDHMDHFVVFLEVVAMRRWGQTVGDHAVERAGPSTVVVDEEADKQDQVAVWNTLLELYLTLPAIEGKVPSYRDKAHKVLLSATIPYDVTHALMLCSSHGYTPGMVLLWEKMGMYEDVLRSWMDRDKEGSPDASAEIMRHLNLYGPDHPHLYPLVLRFLTSTPDLLARHKDDVVNVLRHIAQEGILPPLGVIQVLSRNGVASVGLVKEWLMDRIREATEEIHTASDLLNSIPAKS